MKNILLVLLSALFITACSSINQDITVTSESNPKINLSGYHSFTWLGEAVVVYDENSRWQSPGFDVDSEAKLLIANQLRSKGFVEKALSPELLVTVIAGVDMDNLEAVIDNLSQLETLIYVPKGALVVAMFDAETGQQVWIGAAEAELQQNAGSEVARERLIYAIDAIFKEMKI